LIDSVVDMFSEIAATKDPGAGVSKSSGERERVGLILFASTGFIC